MADVPLKLIEDVVDSHDPDSLISFHGRTLYHLFEPIHFDAESVHQFLALCDISPIVPSIVCSLKIVSSDNEPQLPSLPNITSLHVWATSTTYGRSTFWPSLPVR
ncbi:uncharacterized protein ARMOST_14360 [Armillaria ostoyae]|uniref:Uncharacterized protein n=1 Tax=Armillaria ostoyae TaxID=47428 RepID=A0A284RQD8_ARMOS|nr:uncharacterized protein ARMOST_14360 [Armillaria ostoyae]